MQHLSLEGLARLVDEAPEAEEAAHLEGCGACRAELDALLEQTRALAALPEGAPPRPAWAVLERRLREEGLVAGGAGRGARRAMRAAAALALFLGGGVAGVALRGGAPEGTAGAAPTAAARDPEAALRRLREAEAGYREALARYAEATGTTQAVDPVNRLAALEGIVLTTRAALDEAPADPVINGYHLAALSQRDAILRQISRSPGEEWF